jgi:transposase
MVDSQSVRSAFTARADTVGVDAHKKVKGRKRNLLVDTLGLLLHVVVTAADVHDVRPGRELIHYAALAHPWITKIWADGAYAGAWEDAAHRNIDLQITTRGLGGSGFTPVPQRWKVERTNSWIGRARRLAKDYEGLPGSAESQIRWAMTAMMLRRLTGRSTLTTYRVARSA